MAISLSFYRPLFIYQLIHVALTLLAVRGVASQQKNLVIDTDLFSDVDDAGALLLAATSPHVNLLAVNVNYPSSYSALAASSILNHYGHGSTPVGIRRPLTNDTFFDGWLYELGEFASKVAHHWPGGTLSWGQAEEAWDPVALYRKVLADAEDGTVTIVSLGFFDNLSGLLNSTADSYSPLSGPELIAAKATELIVMGGEYPSGYEYNFWGGNASLTAHVVNNWAGPVVFLGLEVGLKVLTGAPLMESGPEEDPVRAAYIYYTYCKPRYSWDPLTVLYAIEGLGELFEYGNENGYNRIAANGSNEWVVDETVTNQRWLKLRVDGIVAAKHIDDLFLEGSRSVAPLVRVSPASVEEEFTKSSKAIGSVKTIFVWVPDVKAASFGSDWVSVLGFQYDNWGFVETNVARLLKSYILWSHHTHCCDDQNFSRSPLIPFCFLE